MVIGALAAAMAGECQGSEIEAKDRRRISTSLGDLESSRIETGDLERER